MTGKKYSLKRRLCAGILALALLLFIPGVLKTAYAEQYSSVTEEQRQEVLSYATTDEMRDLLTFMLDRVGYPYSQSERNSGSAYDCSSLVYYAYESIGIDIAVGEYNTAAGEAESLTDRGCLVSSTLDMSLLEPGDLVFYSYTTDNGRYLNISHVAMYVGGGMDIDARGTNSGVVYRTLPTASVVAVCRPFMLGDTSSTYTGIKQDDGTYYYYVKGQKNTTYTGFVKSGDSYWYVTNGVVNSSDDCIYQDLDGVLGTKNAWWHVIDGKVSFDTTVAPRGKTWWYVEKGKVNFSYSGFAENSYGWWYVTKGQVTFDDNSILEGTIDGVKGWYYVKESKFEQITSVEENENGWWYVQDGKVNFKYDGFAENQYGWWYITGGKVTFEDNTIINGTINGVKGWYYVKQSKFEKITSVEKNENGWWYVKDGKVDFTFNNFAENRYGWWYLTDGKVTFKDNTIIEGTVDGVKGWYYVKDSKLEKITSIEMNVNGWWYVEDGKVDFTYNGFAENDLGWWYVTDGKVTFQDDTILKGTVENTSAWWYVKESKVEFITSVEKNDYGWWYIKNGKVDFNFSGLAKNSYGTWVIEKGKVNFDYTGTYYWNGRRYNIVKGKVA